MIGAIQRRPCSIHAYALIVLAVGLDGYIGALYSLLDWEVTFAEAVPQFRWNRDWTIVALSARLTIICIPVVAIWFWGARFARMLVTLFTVLLLASFIRAIAQSELPMETMDITKTVALGLACALLFTPSANRWLGPRTPEPVSDVFE
ncbi:MAG: hypothetical protein AAF251_05245 [Pseudomonadota bacterium]